MNTFFGTLFQFILFREEWLRQRFLDRPSTLSNSIILLFLKSTSEFLIWIFALDLTLHVSYSLLFVFGLVFFMHQLGWVFIKSSIVLLFRIGRTEEHPETPKVFMIYGFCYFPYLFLPAYAVLIMGITFLFEQSQIPILTSIATAEHWLLIVGLVSCWIAGGLYRINFFRMFSKNFYSDPILLVLLPKLIELAMISLLILLIVMITGTGLSILYEYLMALLPPELMGLI